MDVFVSRHEININLVHLIRVVLALSALSMSCNILKGFFFSFSFFFFKLSSRSQQWTYNIKPTML